jgi:NitT/TauT family transport system substrate-binding protein
MTVDTTTGGRLARRSLLAAGAAAVAGGALARPARSAGPETLRIAEQFGVGYLPLHVIRDRDLLAKHGRAAGVELRAEWVKLSGGAALNDALLSGGIDVASGGVTPLLTVWDRTRGSLGVRTIAAMAAMPYFLLTNRPGVASLDDFGAGDKIALPSVGVSIQARTLQMAAARRWGADQWARLDPLTVTLPHPETVAALRSKGAGVTAHFSNPPFQYQQLETPGIRRVLSSYDVLGGPATAILLWSAARLRDERPAAYGAFVKADKAAAAETYARVEGSQIDRGLLRRVLDDPEITFTTTPSHTDKYASFMREIGAIKAAPREGWRDYFFPEAHALAGS